MAFRFLVIAAAAGALRVAAVAQERVESGPAAVDFRVLFWKPGIGVVVRSERAEVSMDQAGAQRGPLPRFPAAGVERVLHPVRVSAPAPNRLLLEHRLAAPDGTRLRVVREIAARSVRGGAVEAVETFRLIPAAPLTLDVEIERAFSADSRASLAGPDGLRLPRKDGWLEQRRLDGAGVR